MACTFKSKSTIQKAHGSELIALFVSSCSSAPRLMEVVDLGTCTIQMDKSYRFSRFSRREPPLDPNDNKEQHIDRAADERPRKRMRRIVDSGTTCAPEQLHCRYANKRCLNPRAVKRTGGLHTFCAMHRANANRNQRRLDMRKRMARQAQKAQKEAAQMSSILHANTSHQQAALVTEGVVSTPSPASQHIDPRFEPLRSPTPLQEEDITTLIALFLPHSRIFRH